MLYSIRLLMLITCLLGLHLTSFKLIEVIRNTDNSLG